MGHYEHFQILKKKYISSVKDDIKKVNKTKPIPQYILWQKEVCEELENKEAHCERIDGNFYFTELLVNKLMYFSYLRGISKVEEKSYARGFDDCLKKMKELLENI